MTLFPDEQTATVAGQKLLAVRLRDAIDALAPESRLSHVQSLHLVATLYGFPNWNTLLARPGQQRLGEQAALEAVGRSLLERDLTLTEQQLAGLIRQTTPLTYTLLEQDRLDTPGKSQVSAALLLVGHMTPGGVEQVLKLEYQRQSERSGFIFRPAPNSIFIWAYPSAAHHQAGAAQWAGMVMRSASDFQAGRPPSFSFKPDLIDAVQAPLEYRYGLSEQIRRTLFLDHCRVENRARMQADQVHPIGFENTREAMRLNSRYKEARAEEGKSSLAQRHGLTGEHYQQVIVEGLVKSWPMAAITDTAVSMMP